jgi:phage terminase large subunit-like protein
VTVGRPAKKLARHVLDATFRARRDSHRELLLGAPLPWAGFAVLQQRFAAASSEAERRELAREFERAVQIVRDQAIREQAGGHRRSIDAELAELGKPGSASQLLRFFPRYFVHPKGPMLGRPFQLEPWQKRFLRELYRRDKRGRRVYRLAMLGVPRGNGKTPLAAGLGLYELLTRLDAPEIYFAAGSKDQAGIGLEFARSFVEQGPLADWITVKSALTCPSRSGTMRVVSADGRLQHGRAPAAGLIDELWAFESSREQQTYIALSSALHKRDDAYLLAITTAGYDKRSQLGRIYEAALAWPEVTTSKDGCLTIAKDIQNGQLLYWYGAPEHTDINDRKIWRSVNPASWIKLRDLQRQLHDPGLGEHEFRRLHLNQWTRSRDAWLPGDLWSQLRSDQQIPDGAPIHVGVDIGLYHDSTAVCIAHRLEDGRIVLRAHVWATDPDAPAHTHVPGGTMQLELVEDYLTNLARQYDLREVAYDPRFFERSAQLLAAQGLTMVEFLQASAPMADAYQAFYQAATEHQLTHNGDTIFAAHIEATAADKTERGWKVRKLKSSQHIDACVAAVLASARARLHQPEPGPQIHWLEWP